jgi:pimeloyl-ACP methyl ester carboxylesterase
MDTMARDVIGIMQQLHLERAHIIGSSLGAEVGLSMAANYPEKVISLVCDGALSSEYGPYSAWEGSQADFEEHVTQQLEKLRSAPEIIYPSIDAIVEENRKTLEKYGWWNEHVEAMVRYGAHQVGEGRYTRGFPRQAMQVYMQNYFQYRLEDYYSKLKCPVLMLAGEGGDEREKSAMLGLKELAQQGEIAKVSGWEHPYGWLLTPDGVCNAILKFLYEIEQMHE